MAVQIKLKRKYLVRKPTQEGYRPASGSGDSGTHKRTKVSHNSCLAQLDRLQRETKRTDLTVESVGCPHGYRPEEHPRAYDALRGRYLPRSR